MIVSGFVKKSVDQPPVVVRLFVLMTFILKPSIFDLMALVLELIVALFSVRILVLGLYITIPVIPLLIAERLVQLAEVTCVPAIQRSNLTSACAVVGANIATNNATMVAYMFLSRFGFIVSRISLLNLLGGSNAVSEMRTFGKLIRIHFYILIILLRFAGKYKYFVLK